MEDIIKQISLTVGKDKRVIECIVHHPLLFTKRVIENPEDIRAVMIPYFGKFVFKTMKTLEDKKCNMQKFLRKKSIASKVQQYN
jgi:hypothetical protein